MTRRTVAQEPDVEAIFASAGYASSQSPFRDGAEDADVEDIFASAGYRRKEFARLDTGAGNSAHDSAALRAQLHRDAAILRANPDDPEASTRYTATLEKMLKARTL